MADINLTEIIIFESPSHCDTTVYLIDEHHGHDTSTRENIEIAKHLIAHNNVGLIGVEGYKGGFRFNTNINMYTDNYYTGNISENNRIGDYPLFAQEMVNQKAAIVGVDSEELSDKAVIDFVDYGIEARLHPNQFIRSLHFIKTLFDEYNLRGSKGNLILNCGARHNDDILNLINMKINANFKRICSLSHPRRA